VAGSMRRRVSAITHSALLAWRSSPRLSRWRTVLPEEASTGLTPHRPASAASEVRRSVVRANCNGAQNYGIYGRYDLQGRRLALVR
jgi:hypothetical protein